MGESVLPASSGIDPRKCRHCRHVEVIWSPVVATHLEWCGITGAVTRQPCDDYDREPGADDE